MANSRSMRKKNRKSRRWLKILLVLVLLIVGGVSFYAYDVWHSANSASKRIYQKLDKKNIKNSREEENIEVTKEPFTILMAGVDTQGGGEGRSDVLMLLTVNPQKKLVYELSIPRDTRVYVPAAGKKRKITESFSYGGIESAIQSVNELIDVPIDYYITTNFEGFEDVVDTLGGIDVDVPFTFKAQLTHSLKWKTYTKGHMFLNGNEALAYVRMRKSDPQGDFGRNERQKQVVREIIDKGTSFSSITKIDKLLDNLGDNVKTNIPPSKLLSFVKLYSSLKSTQITNLKLEGEGGKINGIYYYNADQNSLDELNTTIKGVLNGTVTSSTNNTTENNQ